MRGVQSNSGISVYELAATRGAIGCLNSEQLLDFKCPENLKISEK
jgi:hypothetical protein